MFSAGPDLGAQIGPFKEKRPQFRVLRVSPSPSAPCPSTSAQQRPRKGKRERRGQPPGEQGTSVTKASLLVVFGFFFVFNQFLVCDNCRFTSIVRNNTETPRALYSVPPSGPARMWTLMQFRCRTSCAPKGLLLLLWPRPHLFPFLHICHFKNVIQLELYSV